MSDASPFIPAASEDSGDSRFCLGERTASTGLMPDFAFSGEGVSIATTGDDTPAHKAGLLKGDVITAINGTQVKDLRSYSNMLKQFAPGDTIEVSYTRDGAQQTTELTLQAR